MEQETNREKTLRNKPGGQERGTQPPGVDEVVLETQGPGIIKNCSSVLLYMSISIQTSKKDDEWSTHWTPVQ